MKIKADFHQKMRTSMPKTSKIEVEVGEDKYEIEVKNFITAEERVAMLEDLIDFIEEDEELNEEHAQVLTLMVMYKALTDIEFPTDRSEQVDQFTWLAQTGVLSAVNKIVDPSTMEELSSFLQLGLENLGKEMQRILKENEKTKQKPAPGRPITK